MNRKNLIGNQTLFISILLGGILPSLCFAQLSISSLETSYTIDFDNTVSGVNSGEFDGSGFASSPSDGQLDCDGIIATGLSDGDGAFGTDKTSGDFARGTDSASPHNGVGTGGIYAFEVSSGNYAIGVQPGGSDFTPGSFILKITNSTGSTINAVYFSYTVYIFNDQGRANTFNSNHSSDGTNYTEISEFNITSTASAASSASWEATTRSATFAVSLDDGDIHYIKWTGNDDSGSGSRDEFALDDIVIHASGGTVMAGDAGFRMMSSPVDGTVYDDILGPLWIQGMTNGDVTDGTANVWTYDAANTEWDALSNLNTASLTAGQGYLVYVFTDVDNDGDDDLPVALSVSGTENSATVSVSTTASEWNLLGNPFLSTIDADQLFSDNSNYTSTVYVYDDANSQYNTWNGSTGDLSNGLIAPYQGFWIESGGSGTSFDFTSSCKSTSESVFYKLMINETGSMSFAISSGEDYEDNAFVSFMTNGEAGMDNSDAYKLLPMTASERVVGISYAEDNGLDINNLPVEYDGSISIPLDIMYLTLDENYNFVTQAEDVNMTWDLSSLPGHISMTLTDNITGNSVDLTQQSEVTFATVEKGSFPAYGSGGVSIYPQVGESRFTLTATYSSLSAADDGTNVPKEFALHPAYPNPFNPSTTITFDVPLESRYVVSLQLYDIKGQLVETLINEVLPAGSHRIQWSPQNLASGLYIVQLKAGQKTFNQKITFIK